MFMNEKGRQMHTPKAASDFQNKLPWMGFELATCFLGIILYSVGEFTVSSKEDTVSTLK